MRGITLGLKWTKKTITLEREDIRKYPKKRIIRLWKSLTNRPLPRMKVLITEEEPFLKWSRIVNSELGTEGVIKEYRSPLDPEGCLANVSYNRDRKEHLILIRKAWEGKKRTRKELEENLRHELRHIIKGEVKHA